MFPWLFDKLKDAVEDIVVAGCRYATTNLNCERMEPAKADRGKNPRCATFLVMDLWLSRVPHSSPLLSARTTLLNVAYQIHLCRQ